MFLIVLTHESLEDPSSPRSVAGLPLPEPFFFFFRAYYLELSVLSSQTTKPASRLCLLTSSPSFPGRWEGVSKQEKASVAISSPSLSRLSIVSAPCIYLCKLMMKYMLSKAVLCLLQET